MASKYLIFSKVAEFGNITKAAQELNYTQSAISHVINNLEEEYGFPLVIRSKSGITLTDAGKEILGPMQQLTRWETILDQTASSLRNGDSGLLRIGFFSGVSSNWLPQITKLFAQEHPNVQLSFYFANYEELREKLIKDELDCCFLNKSYSDGFHFFPLYDDDYFVVLPSNHPLAIKNFVSFEEIKNEEYIMSDSTIMNVEEYFDKYQLKIKYRINDDYAIVAMVEEGLGISVLPRTFLNSFSGNIIAIPLGTEIIRTVGIAIRTVKYATPAMNIFVNYARILASNMQLFNK